MSRIHFTLDGREISAIKGQSVLEAAEEAGHWIPRLCHMKNVTPHGACRVCTCYIDGRPQSACTYPATEGIEVEAESERLRELRRDVVEMLFVDGNHYCMACEKSGNCELQALAYRLEITSIRHRYLWPERDVDASHPDLWIDRNRCIQCGRCVRAGRDLDHKSVFQFTERGHRQRVGVNSAQGLAGTAAEVDDAASHACPVGAILPKRVGFATPVGERAYDRQLIGEEVDRVPVCSGNGGKQS